MGYDIRINTEIKVNGTWHCYGTPNMGRYYQLFEKMAGVRGRVENAISPPRGIPSDASVVTALRAKEEGTNGHHHSYVNADEIRDLEDWYLENMAGKPSASNFVEYEWGFFFGNSWGDFAKGYDRIPSEIEDVRFVFWFTG